MRTFQLHRDIDSSGVSGLGVVAEGVQFTNGKVVISWLTKTSSLGIYDSLQIMADIHGHGGNTRVVWTDKLSVRKTPSIPKSAIINAKKPPTLPRK